MGSRRFDFDFLDAEKALPHMAKKKREKGKREKKNTKKNKKRKK